ncbi:hypothetical protein CAPTEDRAFT_225460 [Capitella teleta]|uniref:RING-CH-type domain-containing protein n=1 Tax=Capitella teleta TaxID=283909 RepID=R7U258_CAPTE|nr:hypothetical protein CAPTEDRAFT_225460 [Capitella teleta]|eukprot:ELU00080.1 hypothetical protein CAPTEDRAFT_225460 [Capitella teleta]
MESHQQTYTREDMEAGIGYPSICAPLMMPGETCSPSGTCTPMSGACTPLASPSHGPSTPIPSRAMSVIMPLPGTSASRLCLSHSDSCSTFLPSYTTSLNFDSKSNLSETNSTLNPICRICHMTGTESDGLISPCRCAGSLQYIHSTCLTRWLEICGKKSRKPPKCELCRYQYHRHKKFKLSHWRFPRVSRQDKALHIVFIINLLIMVACAIATVMCFLSDKGRMSNLTRNKASLTTEEIVTLSCGVLFFVSFFIAMSVQIKAKHTIYQLFVKFVMQNMQWEIDQYDKRRDSKLFRSTTAKGSTSYV